MSKKILVIDDNEINCSLLEELLSDDYELTTSQSSSEGFTLARSILPDLVLLDVMMPGKDGYQLCRMLKADELTADSKVILVTAKAMKEDVAEGLRAGADDYVSKPFDLDHLLLKVRKQLGEAVV